MAEYVMEYDGWAEGIPAVEYLKVCSAMHARKREEIVRCRDCVSCHRDESGMWCGFYGTGFYRRPTGESDYCSKGKRRDA